MKINAWKTLSRKTVFSAPPWLEIEQHHLRLPDGREISDWLWVRSPDFVNVVAFTAEGLYLCFRQQKYAAGEITLAIPGGYLEEGEDPRDAAVRELKEETGWIPGRIRLLGSYAIDGNRGCGRGHLFLAEDCVYAGGEVTDDLEDQDLVKLSRAELLAALRQGAFRVMPWAAALALALLPED